MRSFVRRQQSITLHELRRNFSGRIDAQGVGGQPPIRAVHYSRLPECPWLPALRQNKHELPAAIFNRVKDPAFVLMPSCHRTELSLAGAISFAN